MRLALGASVLATATACGGKSSDPYAKSLALGSEHVEFTANVKNGAAHELIKGSGDFTNAPDRGHYSFVASGRSQQQIFANGRLYVRVLGRWLPHRLRVRTPQTPAQMFRAHLPAKIENGVVRSITLHSHGSVSTYVFSRYGEPVSITIPRVKGSK